MNNSS
jgi:tetratricopeptide (TPR) repeat protein